MRPTMPRWLRGLVALSMAASTATLTTLAAAAPAGANEADLRTRYYDSIDDLRAGRPDAAVQRLEQLNQEIGKPTPRIQAALVRAAAAAGMDQRVVREFEVWRSLNGADTETTRELEELRNKAQTKLDTIEAAKRREASEKVAAQRQAAEAARAKLEELLGGAEESVSRALRSSNTRDSARAIERVRSAVKSYPREPRSTALAAQVPVLEAHIQTLEESAAADKRQAEENRLAARAAAADEASSKATKAYILGTTWLVLGLASGAGAVYFFAEKPLGEETLEVVLPGSLLAAFGAMSLVWSFDDFDKASIQSKAAARLRASAPAPRVSVAPAVGGAAITLSGYF